MEPATYNITIRTGATYELDLQYKDSNGVAIDMTNYSVAAQLWDRLATAKVADFVLSWTDQATGQFKLTLSAASTQALTDQGQYDVLITEPGGEKYYILQGKAAIEVGLTGQGL